MSVRGGAWLAPAAGGLRRGSETLRDLFWPRRCAGCGLRGGWLCDDCRERHPVWTPPWCARCGVPDPTGCRCGELSTEIDAARSAGRHDAWLQTAVHLFKYSQEAARAEQFGPLLASAGADLPPIELLVPVPLHRRRFQERGYNQSELLARALSAEIGIGIAPEGAFTRLVDTPHQTRLSAEERQRNLAGAFAVARPDPFVGKHLLLVDDVLTTGATVRECAFVLKRAGASKISIATISRALS